MDEHQPLITGIDLAATPAIDVVNRIVVPKRDKHAPPKLVEHNGKTVWECGTCAGVGYYHKPKRWSKGKLVTCEGCGGIRRWDLSPEQADMLLTNKTHMLGEIVRTAETVLPDLAPQISQMDELNAMILAGATHGEAAIAFSAMSPDQQAKVTGELDSLLESLSLSRKSKESISEEATTEEIDKEKR